MSALHVAGVSIRRVLRDRRALFFLVILPIFVILIVGTVARGFSVLKVGVVDLGAGAAGRQLTAELAASPELSLTRYDSLHDATQGVARGDVAAAVVLPEGMDADLRANRTVKVGVMTELANSTQQAAATAVESVIAKVGGRVQAAQFASSQVGGTYATNLGLAKAIEGRVGAVTVRTRQVESAQEILPEGYSYSAPTMLVLFVFISALSGGAAIVEVRRLGIYERIAAGPVRTRTIILGEFLALAAIALVQSALIVVIGAAIFGVSWGDPLAAFVLVVLWSLVGASAGMLAGALFRTPEQAGAIGATAGMVFGMLGGCMWPLAILSSTFRQVGHIVPQAWAVDAWTQLLSRGGTLASIGLELAVLAGFGVVFLALAALRLRRRLSA